MMGFGEKTVPSRKYEVGERMWLGGEDGLGEKIIPHGGDGVGERMWLGGEDGLGEKIIPHGGDGAGFRMWPEEKVGAWVSPKDGWVQGEDIPWGRRLG
jgi:hypothetical protein